MVGKSLLLSRHAPPSTTLHHRSPRSTLYALPSTLHPLCETIVISIRSVFLLAVLVTATASASAQEPIQFARTPDISPDGKLVTFSYLGDIWVVEAIGGIARPVTMHKAHRTLPLFQSRWTMDCLFLEPIRQLRCFRCSYLWRKTTPANI